MPILSRIARTPNLLVRVVAVFLISVNSHAQGPGTAAVSSARPLATEAGIEILRQGGNAFDAAVAVTAALSVVDPSGAGLGGGGFWLIHRQSDGKQAMIDGREKAPGFAHRRMYLDDKDEIRREILLNSPLGGAIPGLPAGMVYLARNFGRLPLATSLAPAIRYAEQGFAVTADYRKQISRRAKVMKRYPASAAIFLQDGQIPDPGYMIVQTDLAAVLKSIAARGNAGFYSGEVAGQLVRGMQQHGGIWTLQDLENYVALERQPFVTTYHDITVVSASPPSSGGIVMGQALKILEHFDLRTMDRITRAHHIIEAMRRAFRDRAVFLGDPDFVRIPVHKLFDEDYIEGLALGIDCCKATPSKMLGDIPDLEKAGSSTTHFSVMDAEGNRVAGTLSLNLSFGTGFVIPGTGILVNNEMDDFSIKPGEPNVYGLIGFEANAIEPGKRPLSSMSPAFIETDERIGILGTPGGSRIISMVLLGILDFADGRLPESWVDRPRYHHQYEPDMVYFEANAFTEDERRDLAARGHALRPFSGKYGDMHAILWDKRTGHVYAAADKRGEGLAILLHRQKQDDWRGEGRPGSRH